MHAEVGAGDRPQPLLQLVQGRRDHAVLGHALGAHDGAVHPGSDWPDAKPQIGLADFGHYRGHLLRRRGHLDLAQQPLDLGGFTGEADAEQFAHRTAAAVAADEVARAQPRAVGQLDGHPVVVLAQPDQLAAAPDLGTELGSALGQQAVGDGLRDAEDVGMCGVQPVRLRLADAGEGTTERILLAEREEPLQQTALIHHLDAAYEEAERADMSGRLRLLLQHEHVHAVQPQLAGQHQAGRSTAGDDHVDHEPPSPHGCISARCSGQRGPTHRQSARRSRIPNSYSFWPRLEILQHDPGLAASPVERYMLEVARSG